MLMPSQMARFVLSKQIKSIIFHSPVMCSLISVSMSEYSRHVSNRCIVGGCNSLNKTLDCHYDEKNNKMH